MEAEIEGDFSIFSFGVAEGEAGCEGAGFVVFVEAGIEFMVEQVDGGSRVEKDVAEDAGETPHVLAF